MATVLRFFQEQVQKQEAERARVRVLQGPEVGTTFVLLGRKAIIGRSEDCEIPISDGSASRRHAQIEWDRQGWHIRDLGSANGILHNGQVAREGFLSAKDTIEIGETILEFIPSDSAANLALIEAPIRNPVQQLNERKALEAQKQRVRQLGESKPVANASATKKNSGPNKALLAVVGLAAVGYLFQDQLTGGKSGSTTKKAYVKREPSNFEYKVAPPSSGEFTRSVDTFFKSGFREYREGNLLRAKYQFEMALQIDPTHALSKLYLQNTLTQVRTQVDQFMIRGSQAEQAGKLREAKGHYENVLRMLSKDIEHPKYLDAKQRLDRVKSALGERT